MIDKKRILVLEYSQIVYQGISNILRKKLHHIELVHIESWTKVQDFINKYEPSILIINPSTCAENNGERLKQLRQEAINSSFKMVALVYAYFDEQILSLFDDVIYINDSEQKIEEKINHLLANPEQVTVNENANLSQRELDVIKLVALGYSNREIADELYISIHTVISHRKNITNKLGIKSASGLAIYAVINKLIGASDFDKTV